MATIKDEPGTNAPKLQVTIDPKPEWPRYAVFAPDEGVAYYRVMCRPKRVFSVTIAAFFDISEAVRFADQKNAEAPA